MNSYKKVLSVLLALVFALTATTAAFGATNAGDASIGFSIGGITYEPLGISGITPSLGLSFGQHDIETNSVTKTYRSENSAGYVVNNRSGGTGEYTVTLTLSPFDNGLQGATMTISHDGLGVISDVPGAYNPPILLGGRGSVLLEADGMSAEVVLQGTKRDDDESHTALGRWGANFIGDLNVYTNTIVAGDSKAVMTWELIIA